jgi:hypothetical protein
MPNVNVFTAAGGQATPTPNKVEELRRTIMASLLWEDIAYESGESVPARIQNLVPQIDPQEVSKLAIEARDKMYLRHVPLMVVNELSAVKPAPTKLVAETLAHVIQRPDEITEFLSIYWKGGRKMLSRGVRAGLSKAFNKFDEYSFAKNQHASDAVKMRDALFMSHAKPENAAKEILFKKIADKTLSTPDTWETNLSAGKDKKETFERLLREKRLGGLATLRNLRNMIDSDVDSSLIKDRLENGRFDKVLPYRFLSAADYAPQYESSLEKAMLNRLKALPPLPGKSLLILDVSGSMGFPTSRYSKTSYIDAGIATLMLAKELCEESVIYLTAGSDSLRKHQTSIVPDRHGFALRDAIIKMSYRMGGGGIFLVQCLDYIKRVEKSINYERVLVFTDEQDCDRGVNPNTAEKLGKFNYIMNVSSHTNGVGYQNGWTTVSGFSENIFEYMRAVEGLGNENMEDQEIYL